MENLTPGDIVFLAQLMKQPDEQDSDDDPDDDPDDAGSSGLTPAHIGPPKTDENNSKNKSVDDELPDLEEIQNEESLIIPDYEVIYKQEVTPEDLFLQLGEKTPGSAHCDGLIVVVSLDGIKDKEDIRLDVQRNFMQLKTPLHFLKLHLSRPTVADSAHAQWDGDKQRLRVIVVLEPWDTFEMLK